MKKQGWIALHRKIQSHWLWDEKPFDRAHAWVDMLLMANHEDNKFALGNELIVVEQGSFITSIEKLKTRWGWSNTKVISFLNLLESDQMIVKKSDTKKTVITIVKYGEYAVLEDAEKMRKRYEKDAEKMPEHTNNNDNNDNNENNIKKERKKDAPSSYEKILSAVSDVSLKELYFSYIQMRKMIGAPLSNKALETLIKRVNDLEPHSVDRQKKMLEAAILNNWKNVYPLKEETKPKTQSSNPFLDMLKGDKE